MNLYERLSKKPATFRQFTGLTACDDYADFHLRIEAMLDATADSGAYVRLQPFTPQGVSGRERGYEVQMNCEARDANRTGGLLVAPPAGGPVLVAHHY
jgi:hypothetical protein